MGGQPVTSAPLTSIALLTYNRRALLERALASARAQDYPNLQILVLDNASTDATESFCRAVERDDARIRYVRHRRNFGAISNFNAGLRLATGSYFMWLADDDWITPNYISACVALLESDPHAALVTGETQWVDDPRAARYPKARSLSDPDPEMRVLTYLSDPMPYFYGVYRRELLCAVGYKRIIAGDWLTVAAIAAQGTLVSTSAATIYLSPGGTSRSRRHAARALGMSLWQSFAPKVATALSIASYFWRNCPAANLDRGPRRRLATRAFLVLAARKKLLRWLLWFIPRPLRPVRLRRP
jgi:glycosyltransferase involved in cell wall biosynthesis